MHISKRNFKVGLGSIAHIGHRQIYRFDYFEGGKFGYSDKRSEIALCFCTYSYASRCVPLNTKLNCIIIKP